MKTLRRAKPLAGGPSWVWAGCMLMLLAFALHFIAGGLALTPAGPRFTLMDDAMISMRYAHNLAADGRLAWSPASAGTEGFSNLLWTLLMAVCCWALPAGWAPLAVSLLSLLLLLLGARRLAAWKHAPWGDWPAAHVLAAVLACTPLVFWSLRGFETACVFFLLAVLYGQLAPAGGAGAARPLAVITAVTLAGVFCRDDFAVLLLLAASLAWLLMIAQGGRPDRAWRALILGVLLAVALKTACRLLLFHAWLPNPLVLKMTGHDPGQVLLRGLMVGSRHAVGWLLGPLLFCLLLSAAIAPAAMKATAGRLRHLTWQQAFPFLVLLSSLAYSLLVGGDAWEWSGLANRFVAPALPPAAIVLALALRRLGRQMAATPAPARGRLLTAVPLALACFWGLHQGVRWLSLHWESRAYSGLFGAGLSAQMNAAFQALALLGLLVAARLGWQRLGQTRALAGALLILWGAALLPSVRSLVQADANFVHLGDDADKARFAARHQALIPAGARAAAKWAGTYPYYLPQVDFVDPLGRLDKRIARMKPKWPFYPGHTKWDWDYILRVYRPDFILGTPERVNVDTFLMDRSEQWSLYRPCAPLLLRRTPPGG